MHKDSLFEEIHSIYTSILLNSGKISYVSVTTDDPEIFIDNAVFWTLMEPERWKINVIFDPINHTVYQLDVINIQDSVHHRWINSKFKKEFDQNSFDRMLDPTTHSHYGKIHYTGDYGLDVLTLTARDLVEDITYNNDGTVNIPIDLTDSELATIARAAHVQNVTINDFINEALKIELDRVSPDWREEYKKAYGGKCCGGC